MYFFFKKENQCSGVPLVRPPSWYYNTRNKLTFEVLSMSLKGIFYWLDKIIYNHNNEFLCLTWMWIFLSN